MIGQFSHFLHLLSETQMLRIDTSCKFDVEDSYFEFDVKDLYFELDIDDFLLQYFEGFFKMSD